MSLTADLTNCLGIPLVLLITLALVFFARRMSTIPERMKGPRTSGIIYPWDKWQILVVSVTVYNIFVFYAVVGRSLETAGEVIADLIESILLIITISLWIYLSTMDPCIAKTDKPIGNEYWCRFCQSYYEGEKRKHCRHCKKCVIGFDHHCFFLNTCIADHNYKPFVSLLCTYTCVLTLQVLGVCVAISRIVNNDADSVFGDGTNTFKWLKQDYEEEKLRAKLKAYEIEMTRGINALSGSAATAENTTDTIDTGVASAEANPVASPQHSENVVANVEVVIAKERA